MPYSASVEDYLKTLCKLGGSQQAVPLADLAEGMAVSAVSVHEMVRRLMEQDLVDYEPYKGVALRPAGLEVATRVLQQHRLWERFLHDHLGLPWATVHQEASRLEHAASPLVMQKLSDFLDNPASCPHGYPISDAGQDETALEHQRLSELMAGNRAVVARVPEDDGALLDYLERLGLLPDVVLEVVEVAPFGGPIRLSVGGRVASIGVDLARQIVVRPAEAQRAIAGDNNVPQGASS